MSAISMPEPDSVTGKRLSLALGASLIAHAMLIAGVGIAPPQGGMAMTLRASIIPLSMPNLPQVDATQSLEAPRELNTSLQTAPRPPQAESTQPVSPSDTASRNTSDRAGIAAELPIYYRGDEVDVRATPRMLASNSRAVRSLLLGRMVKVKLRLYIGDTGEVDRFEILEADGLTPSITLDDVREIPFHPAQRNGRPVRSQKTVELTFTP